MLKKVMDLLPVFISLVALLASFQLGADKYVLILISIAFPLVYILSKRCGENAAESSSAEKMNQMKMENKGLKDNLMKVYTMLQEQKKDAPPVVGPTPASRLDSPHVQPGDPRAPVAESDSANPYAA